MRTRRGLAVVAAALTLLAGCTDGDPEEAATPPRGDAVHEDWVTYERDGVTLAHPPDWEVRDEGEGRVDLVGPEGGDLAPIVSVRWDSPVGLSASESLQAATGNVVTTMPDVEPGEAETFETAGSLEAAKRRIEYTQPLSDGEIAVIELQAVVLGEAVEVLVRAVHRADEFEQVEDTFEDIAASIDVLASPTPTASGVATPTERFTGEAFAS